MTDKQVKEAYIICQYRNNLKHMLEQYQSHSNNSELTLSIGTLPGITFPESLDMMTNGVSKEAREALIDFLTDYTAKFEQLLAEI